MKALVSTLLSSFFSVQAREALEKQKKEREKEKFKNISNGELHVRVVMH